MGEYTRVYTPETGENREVYTRVYTSEAGETREVRRGYTRLTLREGEVIPGFIPQGGVYALVIPQGGVYALVIPQGVKGEACWVSEREACWVSEREAWWVVYLPVYHGGYVPPCIPRCICPVYHPGYTTVRPYAACPTSGSAA